MLPMAGIVHRDHERVVRELRRQRVGDVREGRDSAMARQVIAENGESLHAGRVC